MGIVFSTGKNFRSGLSRNVYVKKSEGFCSGAHKARLQTERLHDVFECGTYIDGVV